MITTPPGALRQRAEALVAALAIRAPRVVAEAGDSVAYLGSGSLPTEAIPSVVVTVSVRGLSAEALARALRTDEAQVFGRIEDGRLRLDLRTVADGEVAAIAAALARATS
jgi:L-seryl-tRNA(Ser) seleniumtransferase